MKKLLSAVMGGLLLINPIAATASNVLHTENVVFTEISEQKLNSYLVQYEQGTKDALVDEIDRINGIIESELDFINTLTVLLSNEQLAAVKMSEHLIRIEQNHEYKTLTYEERIEMAGINEHINQNDITSYAIAVNTVETEDTEKVSFYAEAHDMNIKGDNINIAIFDTGIAPHADLSIVDGVSFVEGTYASDENGHGTNIAGIIASNGEASGYSIGGAPQADIYSVKIADETGTTNTSLVLEGLNWAIQNEIDIINMSFGSYYYSDILNNYIEYVSDNGIIIVGAVGNDGMYEQNKIMYPAAYDDVIAVGSGNAYATTNYSNNSIDLDFVAPGRMFTTTLEGGYSYMTGTSASAAYITSIIALNWSNNISADSNHIINSIKRAGNIADSQDTYVGYGEVSLNVLINEISLEDNDTPIADKADLNNVIPDINSEYYTERNDEVSTYNMTSTFAGDTMEDATTISFVNWQHGYLNEGDEHWYTFVANASGVHPNGNDGTYYISTMNSSSSLDTKLYIYDSYGNELAYNDDYDGSLQSYIEIELEYYETYYIKVEGYNSSSYGTYYVRVSYMSDDYGDTMDTAESIRGIYYEDFIIEGYISVDDVDYFYFVPANDCYIELYSEGNVDLFANLYDEYGDRVDYDDDTGTDLNFYIKAKLTALEYYYLRIHQIDDEYGTYELYTKFIVDYTEQYDNGTQYEITHWLAEDQDAWPEYHNSLVRSKFFVENIAKSEYLARVIMDAYSKRLSLKDVIDNGTVQDIASFIADQIATLIETKSSTIPASDIVLVGGFALSIYNFMNDLDEMLFMQEGSEIEDTNRYIICEDYIFYGNQGTGEHRRYSNDEGDYLGAEYQRGTFVIYALK